MNSPIIELNWTSLMILFNIAILYFIMKRFFFDLFEPALQAYIFVMLTMVFTSNGMHVEEDH